MQVKLSTGQTVHFKPHFTHKADKVYLEEVRRGVVLEKGEGDSLVAKAIPAGNIDLAYEAAIPYLIERIEGEHGEVPYSQDWLDSLSVKDYRKLSEAVRRLRKDSDDEKEAGKKNAEGG